MLDTLRSALQGKIDLPYRLVVSILGLVSVVFRAKPCDGIARLADWFGLDWSREASAISGWMTADRRQPILVVAAMLVLVVSLAATLTESNQYVASNYSRASTSVILSLVVVRQFSGLWALAGCSLGAVILIGWAVARRGAGVVAALVNVGASILISFVYVIAWPIGWLVDSDGLNRKSASQRTA